MKTLDLIPSKYLLHLRTVLEVTPYLTGIDEENGTVQRFIRRKHLKKLVRNDRVETLEALEWAQKHPHLPYRDLYDVGDFSNEDCVKLFKIFEKYVAHVDDEGPDLVPPCTVSFVPDGLD